jgi:hypothetical protein
MKLAYIRIFLSQVLFLGVLIPLSAQATEQARRMYYPSAEYNEATQNPWASTTPQNQITTQEEAPIAQPAQSSPKTEEEAQVATAAQRKKGGWLDWFAGVSS